MRTTSSIERRKQSADVARTANTIATLEDTVKAKLQVLYLFCRVFVPVSIGTLKIHQKYQSYSKK